MGNPTLPPVVMEKRILAKVIKLIGSHGKILQQENI
jgi:hypothetical protein